MERESSSDRSVSEEASASGLRHRVSEEETKKKKMKKKEEEENRRGYSLSTSNEGESIFARGLRRARICVGKAIRGAEGNQHGRTTCGAERLDGAAGEEGGGWNGVGIGAGGGLRGEVFDKVKRMLMGRKGPVRLTRAKVRFPLD